jgi:hypothetical protein
MVKIQQLLQKNWLLAELVWVISGIGNLLCAFGAGASCLTTRGTVRFIWRAAPDSKSFKWR